MPAEQRLQDALSLIVGDRPAGPMERTDDPGVYPENWREIGHVDYFYRRNAVLVRTADLDRVRAVLAEGDGRLLPQNVVVEPVGVIDGVTRLEWFGSAAFDQAGSEREDAEAAKKPGGTGNYHSHPEDERPFTVPWVLTQLDERFGVGMVRPDTLLPLQDNGHPCPASEPAVVPARTAGPVPPMATGNCCGSHGWDGDGVYVGVVDNGLIDYAPTMWPWMADVTGEIENPIQGGLIAHYAGHGTFVAGCVRGLAPRAEVVVKRVAYPANWPQSGAAYESDVVRAMSEFLDQGADVIVCEFAGDTRVRLPLLTFEAFYDTRLRHLNVAVVAPAGNDSTRLPRFPAAYSWVTGVGALSADGRRRAGFSNFGGWVDVYAPGENLVNAFAVGDYRCLEDPNTGEMRRFEGLADWSGTSFSAPLVAGMIAARMSATGENPAQAAEALLRTALSQAVPGIGPVLRPGDECKPCRCRPVGRSCACGCGVTSG